MSHYAKYFARLMISHTKICYCSRHCSETALTDNLISKVWVAPPGLPPVVGSKWGGQSTGPVRHGESVRNAGAPHGSPLPSNGNGPYRVLVVCHHNLWPAVRTELGQEEWLRPPQNRKQRGPVVVGDQGSSQGHYCS
jgi:hypothetical protein